LANPFVPKIVNKNNIFMAFEWENIQKITSPRKLNSNLPGLRKMNENECIKHK
jgi:hypothetical protein